MSEQTDFLRSSPQSRSDDGEVPVPDVCKKMKVAYRRDLLLSLAELETCKKLPSGFDSSILRELSDTSNGLSQKAAYSGSSGISSKQYQCPWQSPENGLLGKGSLHRAPEYVSGTSASKVQGSGQLLMRSITPYRPPHLSKPNLHSQLDSKDIYNDKTFGSSDSPSQQKAEEKRRRGSFELTRKGQKDIPEKQESISDEQKENLDPDIATLRGDSTDDKKVVDKSSESPNFVAFSTPKNANHYSLDFDHHFNGGDSLDKSPTESIASNETADKHEDSSLSYERIDDPLYLSAPVEQLKNCDESIKLGTSGNLENNPDYGFDENIDGDDEICLPDEDSLITFDDFILPTDSELLLDRASSPLEADLFASSILDDDFEELAAVNTKFGDKRSQTSMVGSRLLSHLNSGRALFPKTSYNLSFHHGFPTIAPPGASQKPFADANSNNPGEFPYKVNGLPSGSTPPPHSITGMTYRSGSWGRSQDFLSASSEMPNLDRGSSGAQAVFHNMLYGREQAATWMHPVWPLPGNF